ncbi:MAG TPA: hypothetical protein VD736_07205 [Nitrososphaera sp.]|jgi:hypothetical protein|nr:hypothetical protein [Nitrososphaera sp.]
MLCRACGSEMVATEYCPSCNEAVLWKCSSCEKENDRSVHTWHPPRAESSRTASVVGALISLVSGLTVVVPV